MKTTTNSFKNMSGQQKEIVNRMNMTITNGMVF